MNSFERLKRHIQNFILLALIALGPFFLYFTQGISFFTLHALAGLMAIKYQAAQAIFAGEYPLWNPYMLCGAPFHSGIGILDPFLVLYKLLKTPDAMMASAYLALVIAGWGTYLYLRKVWRLSFTASMIGGILYLTNPFFAATSHEQPFMAPAVYLPFIFLFYELHLKDKSWSKLIASSFFLSLTFFSGNLESFYFVLLYFVVIQSSRIGIHSYYSKSITPFLNELRSGVLCVFFTFCFMMADFLPTLQMIFYSGRNANESIVQNLINALLVASFSFMVVWLADRFDYLPQALAKKRPWIISAGLFLLFALHIEWKAFFLHLDRNLFYPNVKMLFSNGEEAFYLLQKTLGLSSDILKSWMEPRFVFYIQPPIYLFTLSTLVLFVLAVSFTHNRYFRFLGAFAVFLVLFAYTSVPNLNYYLFHLDQITYPRIMFIFFFLISFIIAQGYERLAQNIPQLEVEKSKGLAKTGLILCCIALTVYLVALLPQADPSDLRKLVSSFYQKTQAKVSFLDLSLTHARINLESLRLFAHLNRWIYAFGAAKYASLACLLAIAISRRRIFRTLFVITLTLDVLAAWNFYTFQKKDIRLIQENTPEIQFLKTMSTDSRIGTLANPSINLRNFYEFDRAADVSGNIPMFFNRRSIEGLALNLSPRIYNEFWSLEPGNVSSVLSKPISKIYDLMGMNYLFTPAPITDTRLELAAQGAQYLVYKNMAALPRFYFAKSVYSASEKAIKQQVQSPAWAPFESTLIDAQIPEEWRMLRSSAPALGVIHAEQDKFNELLLTTESANAEFLATTESFHPNWKVFVDEKPAPVIKVNDYFRGVFLSPGNHKVRFYYQPPNFLYGKMVSLAMLIFFIAVSIYEFSIKRIPVKTLQNVRS